MTTNPTPTQPPAAVPEAPACCNAWFVSLPEGRQAVLRDDKWMLAHAAYEAGRAAGPQQVAVDFPQVGTAGPFPVVNGRVTLAAETMQDLVAMLRPTWEALAATQADQPSAALTVEEAIAALKIALRDSKGWMQSYSDALIRDAIERVPGADVPRMTPEEINALPEKARDYIHQLVANADPAGMVRENMQLRDTNEGLQRMYRKAADALAAAAPMSAQPSDVEALRHSANEWADMATNGLQWLRNVVDGTSDAKSALRHMEQNLTYCRLVNDAPAVQAAIKSAAAAPAPTTEQAAPVWKKLPYKTPAELWKAFKAGATFVLHYHGKTYPVERMQAQRTVCYVEPPGFPVKVYPDGRNCESAGEAIWLEQLAAPGGEAPAPDALGDKRCQACIDRRDGFYGSYAPDCPVHDDDGNPRAAQSQKGAA